jgi:hypothetical protein
VLPPSGELRSSGIRQFPAALPSHLREEHRDCMNKDIAVQKEGPISNVEIVVLDLVGGLEIIEAAHLGQARQAGFDGQASALCCSTKKGLSGRGPTKLMSPRKTL